MTDRNKLSRRAVLATTAVSLAGVAGCMTGGGPSNEDTTTGMNDGMTTTGGMNDGMTTTDGMNDEMTTTDGMNDDTKTTTGGMSNAIQYDLTNLPSLPMGHYEGWAIFGSEKLSTGTFAAGESPTVEVDRDLATADEIVVTVEPDGDGSERPSGVVALAGALSDGVADLSFPVDFGGVSGSYILATPTNGGNSSETAGVWFLDPSGPSPSLSLPALPKGWVYEGWAVTDGTPLTTGRFGTPEGHDDFDGYSGMDSAPPFPGEDFLRNAPSGVSFPPDLADGSSAVAVTVEPDLDGMDPSGPGPSGIKPLAGTIPKDADDHASLGLTAVRSGVPTGTATVRR